MKNNEKKRRVNIFSYLFLFLLFSCGYFICVLVLYAIPYFGWEIVFGEEMPPLSDFVEYSLWIFVIGASIITLRKKFSLRSGNYFSIKQYLPHFDFSGNRSLVIILVAMCIAIFYLGTRVNNSSLNVEDTNIEDTKEQITSSKRCTRTERYKNLPEFDRVLSLIEQREQEFLQGNPTDTPSYILPPNDNIFNCIYVQYADAKKNLGAEGYFIFDPSSANENYLPIYIDTSYKSTDDLLTASLIYHELTHARQFVALLNSEGGNDCMGNEISAYRAQMLFLGFINKEEQSSIFTRMMNYDPHPQLQILENIYNHVARAANDCQDSINQSTIGEDKWLGCMMQIINSRIDYMVRSSLYYQKQCASN